MYECLYPVKDPSLFYILHSFGSISILELVVTQISISNYRQIPRMRLDGNMK